MQYNHHHHEYKTLTNPQPDLYDGIFSAVRLRNSSAALEMLLTLPDKQAPLKGGWLFEYKYEEALKHEEMRSRRWRFSSAHKISEPITDEARMKKLENMIKSKPMVIIESRN